MRLRYCWCNSCLLDRLGGWFNGRHLRRHVEWCTFRLRHCRKPGIDQVKLGGRKTKAVVLTTTNNIIAETAGKQRCRSSLLKPRIAFTDGVQDIPGIFRANLDADFACALRDIVERLHTLELILCDLLGKNGKQCTILRRRERRSFACSMDPSD